MLNTSWMEYQLLSYPTAETNAATTKAIYSMERLLQTAVIIVLESNK